MSKGSKILRGNFVEERATGNLDGDIPVGHTTCPRISKQGHDQLITADTDLKEHLTLSKEVYQQHSAAPRKTGIRTHNLRQELMFATHDELVAAKKNFENAKPGPVDYTTTNKHYQNMYPEYKSVEQTPSKEHNFLKDQPATFWHEQAKTNKLHGLSAVSDADRNPYAKNAKFTTPLSDVRNNIPTA